MRKAEIYTVASLCDIQLPCKKYTILGYIENQAMIHVQSTIAYLYGIECKGQIFGRTCLMNKVVRGSVSQDVHDEWASKKAKELNKPWGIHHVQTGKESVHFIPPERLLPLLLEGVLLAKPSADIKPNWQARFNQGPDVAYLGDLVALCERLAPQFVDKSKHVNASSHADTMTLREAVQAMNQFQEEIDRLDAKKECLAVDIETTTAAHAKLGLEIETLIAARAKLGQRLENLHMEDRDIKILKAQYMEAQIATAHLITTFAPSTLPASLDPKLLV